MSERRIPYEIHARVTEFCSGNENADAGRTDGYPRRRPYPPPPLRRAGDKNRDIKTMLT